MKSILCFKSIEKQLKNRKIVYITTKNEDYLRIVQEVNIIRKYDENSIIIYSKSKKYMIRIIEVFIKVLFFRFKKYDLVFVGFQPQYIIPFLFWKFSKCDVWTDFFISLYDTLVFDRKILNSNCFLANIIWKLDQITIFKSKYIITDTKSHGSYFINEFGAKEENIFVLYLEANRNLFYPKNEKKPKELENKFIVLYFGSILPLQGVEVVLNTIKLLKDEERIHFIIVGPMGKKHRKTVLSTVTYIDWLTQEELSNYIALSDLCLAGHFSGKIEKANRTIPGKAYIYEAMKKPMILGDSEANREKFECDDEHRFVTLGNEKELADEIRRLSKYNLDN